LGIAGTHSTSSVTGKRVIAGLNTVLLKSLNGGSGVAGGIIQIQNRQGQVKQVDLSSAQTLQDVLDTINNTAGLGVQASLNKTGTGLLLKDTTGSTAVNLKVSDVNSTTAHDLLITADVEAGEIDSGSNQLQYISENTMLSKLNGGKGIAAGAFSITDSTGKKVTINLSSSDASQKTVGDLFTMIRTQTAGKVTASINSTGDGILLTDAAGGGAKLTVANEGSSSTASDLNIAKTAETAGAGSIDGSYEFKISIGGSDTLQTVASKINSLKGAFSATIINDGSGTNSYRLSITSKNSGKAGKLIFNGGQTGLSMYDMVAPRDAIISIGGDGNNSVVATSSSNTFTGLAPGLTLEAKSASSSPVTISVSQDTAAVTEKLKGFVEKFNAIIETINKETKYDTETETAGVLLGNYQADTVRNRLFSVISKNIMSSGSVRRLSDIGITVGTDAKLEFDEEKFLSAYASDSKAIENFFSTQDTGFGYLITKITDELTDTDGVITKETSLYDTQTQNITDRISYLEELLKSKETRLYRSFQNMESALAKIQTIQTSLLSLSQYSSTSSSSSSSS